MNIVINRIINHTLHLIEILHYFNFAKGYNWLLRRNCTLCVLFPNALVNADKLLILPILSLEHIVKTVYLAYFRHHTVHITDSFLGLHYRLRRETAFTEERLKLRQQIYILIFFVVKVGFKFVSNILILVLKIVE